MEKRKVPFTVVEVQDPKVAGTVSVRDFLLPSNMADSTLGEKAKGTQRHTRAQVHVYK